MTQFNHNIDGQQIKHISWHNTVLAYDGLRKRQIKTSSHITVLANDR